MANSRWLLGAVVLLCLPHFQPLLAQTTYTDNFTTPANWGTRLTSSSATTLPVQGGRMNYLTTSTGDEGAAAPWTVATLPLDRDWSVQVGMHISSFTLTQDGQFVDLFLAVGKTGDWMDNNVSIGFELGRWGPSGGGYSIDQDISIDGDELDIPGVDLAAIPDIAVRIAYTASTHNMTLAYDANGATGGYSWTTSGTANIASGTYNMGLAPMDTFTVLLIGSSEYKTVSTGAAYLSNLVVTIGAAPATGPTIATQPQDRLLASGNTTTLTVAAAGTGTLTYRWYRGASGDTSSPVSGATAATLTTPALTTTTSYWARVTDTTGATDSRTATITVGEPPRTTAMPASVTISHGSTTTLTVTAIGTAPLSYQWYRGEWPSTIQPIAGATSAAYTTPALTATTPYWVEIRNDFGGTQSFTATVTVTDPVSLPLAIDQPDLLVATAGTAAWWGQTTTTHDGADAARSGAITHNQTSEFSLTTMAAGTGSFWWKVSSESGHDFLRFYIDGVEQSGRISGSVDWQMKAFTLAQGSHTLKWVYSKDSSTSTDSDCGWVDELVLPAPSPPEIGTQPRDARVALDASANFFVTASATPAPNYRWQRRTSGSLNWSDLEDGVGITGATSASLTLSGTTAEMNGDQFRCVVSNGIAPDTISNPATLVLLLSGAVATFDLTADWLDNTNPNSPWSYRRGTTLLPFVSLVGVRVTGMASGYAPPSTEGDFLPAIFRATASGPTGASNPGFLAGDVVVHSVDAYNGNPALGEATLVWTSPARGTITATGALWYAHGTTARSDDYALRHVRTAATVANGTVAHNSGFTRDAPRSFAVDAVAVEAGDEVVLVIQKSTGQSSGSFVGVRLSISLAVGPGPAPSVTTQPVGRSVAVGGQVSLSVAATGDGVLNYRWQHLAAESATWSDLTEGGEYTGTATTTLTITAASTVQNGDRFRCIVSNGLAPDAISQPATLTVTRGPATVALGNLNCTYDGSPKPVTVATVPVGLETQVTYAGSATPPSGAGTYTVVATVADTDYEGMAQGVLVIAPVATIAGPALLTSTAGGATTIAASVSGATSASFQWQVRRPGAGLPSLGRTGDDGEWTNIAGATVATYTIPSTQTYHAADYRVVVTANGASAPSEPVTVTVDAPAASDARLMNLSTRALCQTGDSILIPGFVISGTGTKKVLIRGVGPRLARFGVADPLADPFLTLKRDSGGSNYVTIATNDDWGTNANAAEIITTAAAVGAFSLVDGSKDSALLVDLPAGIYSAPTGGVGGVTGVSIVELYDADPGSPTTRLTNISNRGYVNIGDKIMIPGFVVSSEGSRTFLIRAVGPRLTSFGVSDVLEDPELTVFQRDAQGADHAILTNDDWEIGADAATTASTASAVGAFALRTGSKDAAFVVTLPPGVYTVNARGKAGTTGVALVEVYLVP